MSTPDDLPWPELGNVSRGATRGNQGHKGVLGSPDFEGRCVLQLRVQPGVLCVRLNKKASEWYRTLDNEVNRATKLTKVYWRKARRRQGYDSHADQDHMELHEWLQQLKDKTMSFLELQIQKGDMPGPPYVMPDDMEFTFLRKFIEREAAGISHNPRLRTVFVGGSYPHRSAPVDCGASGTPDHPYQRDVNGQLIDDSSALFARSLNSLIQGGDSIAQETAASKQALHAARMSLARAQKDTQEAFMRYTTCRDIEQQAKMTVTAAEKRRDDIMALLLARDQGDQGSFSLRKRDQYRSASAGGFSSRDSSFSEDDRSPPRFSAEDVRSQAHFYSHTRVPSKGAEWPEDHFYGNESTAQVEDASGKNKKHLRTWATPQLSAATLTSDAQYSCEGMPSLPPRKRMQHAIPGFDVLGSSTASLHPQNMTLPS